MNEQTDNTMVGALVVLADPFTSNNQLRQLGLSLIQLNLAQTHRYDQLSDAVTEYRDSVDKLIDFIRNFKDATKHTSTKQST